MRKNLCILAITIFLINLNALGQKRLERLQNNKNFEWVTERLGSNLMVYLEKNSYAEKHKDILKERIQFHLKSTTNFIGVESYNKPIHYFILENRERMKLLVGYETNGNANSKNNFVTAIFSENSKSVYSNHELFHLIAMNVWGYPEAWINEGMAVYSDNKWHGYDLHELSKYLIDNDKYLPITNISKMLGQHDPMITYPLLGSFVKFIEANYGRDAIILIWEKGRKRMKKQMAKDINALEQEWLEMLDSVTYNDINY